jgi:UDP-N-acetyl-D-mannosaminuronic acid transferase (WecB/TagA/CpsF family)
LHGVFQVFASHHRREPLTPKNGFSGWLYRNITTANRSGYRLKRRIIFFFMLKIDGFGFAPFCA